MSTEIASKHSSFLHETFHAQEASSKTDCGCVSMRWKWYCPIFCPDMLFSTREGCENHRFNGETSVRCAISRSRQIGTSPLIFRPYKNDKCGTISERRVLPLSSGRGQSYCLCGCNSVEARVTAGLKTAAVWSSSTWTPSVQGTHGFLSSYVWLWAHLTLSCLTISNQDMKYLLIFFAVPS